MSNSTIRTHVFMAQTMYIECVNFHLTWRPVDNRLLILYNNETFVLSHSKKKNYIYPWVAKGNTHRRQ